MNPAFSVLIFTTLSGAGLGLWTWLGLRIALGEPPRDFQALGWILLLFYAGIAVALGLLASFWHLGKPLRAWRAFSQWRTSWLSREGVLAVATFVPAAALLLMLSEGTGPGRTDMGVRVMAGAVALLSLATIACTAMIYASLKPIPAWRHRLVVPGYILFALLTGGLPMLLSTWPGAGGFDGTLPWLLAAIALVLLVLKLAYWRDIDRSPLPQSRGDAIGLPHRKPSVFERPHTEANYITREMAFAVARRHARLLRIASVLLFACIPLLCLFAWHATAGAGWPLPLAIGSALLGAFAERWLFFAQAKHMVTLYY
ncbi:dimethyl sulfoxide reductase anchor subunit family protein [Thermomonas carbonis]|uniref:Dimethyl sulfoxide reductase anchor subunit n=1 Tax=Thermomonas carbonis TaxID=1463158 RepID=A0A7G9STM6_9GAMM|nr:DmsC/YnfH family molybdoenzyme membrane anchor subunit [Thermomonas carbonis]QNN71201.1 dimethyl sulfoxide reductase anchor subunit [Thermomonas carbonis]GHC11257.1 DMSO reductase [Thermomonas carbonis]